jgi:hypothetical protein
MVPMNYKTKAAPDSKKYEAEMNIIMAGPWYIRITSSTLEKSPQTGLMWMPSSIFLDYRLRS